MVIQHANELEAMFPPTEERGSPPQIADVIPIFDYPVNGDDVGPKILREVDDETDKKVYLVLDYIISVVQVVNQEFLQDFSSHDQAR